jgi:hypothetical protein
VSVEVQEVEGVENEPLGLALLDGLVEVVEVGHPARRDLAIDGAVDAQFREAGERRAELGRDVVAV